MLTPTRSPPPAAIGGVYRLTFDASPSCDLPEEARHRTYTATIDPFALYGIPTVTLTGAQFYTGGYCDTDNRFLARVQGNTLFLDGGECGIVELLPNSRFLTLLGRAEATVTDRTITGAFNGSVSIGAGPPDGSDSSKPTATCTATDHRIAFESQALVHPHD
jgi:hypothetical protein